MMDARSGLLALIFAACGVAHAQELTPTAVTVRGDDVFTIKKPAKPAGDLSGIACRAPASTSDFNCFVIDDEVPIIQRARLDGAGIYPGADVILPSLRADFGQPPRGAEQPNPTLACVTKDEVGEFDREAIAYADGFFYVVGSHGCGRKNNTFDHFGFVVTRFRVDASGAPVDVQYSYRLSEVLRAAPVAGEYFGQALVGQRGLNIEGALVAGDVLHVGLRAPSIDGDALVIGSRIDQLFSAGALDAPMLRRIAIDEVKSTASGVVAYHEIGVRDLALLANGDWLVLGGPTEEQQDVRFSLYRVNAANEVSLLGRLPDISFSDGSKTERAKAEALLVLSEDANAIEALIMYDGPHDGAPRRVYIPVSPSAAH
ncbi:hypothetical protein U91I_01153 [alpha proteobacterium U9-1i]|nr:hypothetical protein U91I_01153 [alpha proteobacterium U9-1i]